MINRNTGQAQFRDRMVSHLKPLAMSVFAVSALFASLSAEASQYGVRVVNDSGEPVSGASVCIGLPGNYKQFGALFTDADGMAMVDVPNVPLVVTISKTRFSGLRISEPARGFNMTKQVTLNDGTPGPRCRAGSTIAGSAAIVVEQIDVIALGAATTLNFKVSGMPSHYRVATTAAFDGASWQQYQSSVALPLTLAEQGQVFVQMRRYKKVPEAWLEARSPVVEVRMPIAAR